MAQPPVQGVFVFAYALALRQQVIAAVQELGDLQGQRRLPALQARALQLEVQLFKLDPGQLVFARSHA